MSGEKTRGHERWLLIIIKSPLGRVVNAEFVRAAQFRGGKDLCEIVRSTAINNLITRAYREIRLKACKGLKHTLVNYSEESLPPRDSPNDVL